MFQPAVAAGPPRQVPPPPLKRPAWWVLLLMLLLGGGALAVLFLVDPAQSRIYPKCVLYQTTGLQCPGCGGLRAAHALLHGDFITAYHLNPALVLLSPLLAYVFLREFMKAAFGREWPSPFRRPWMVWLLLGALFAFMVWRNLPWFARLTGAS